MKIRIARDAVCGSVPIAPGEYWVALRHERREIALVSKGHDLLIPAMRRLPKGRGKTTVVTFYCGGGACWTLSISSPLLGEWVAFIEYKELVKERERKRE